MGQDSLILPPISLPSCPVNLHTLPIELLAYIFLFCTKVLKDPTLPYPAWLPITHVCRHWRTVALTHAKLWTSIDPGLSSQWVKVFMERSQTMLMDFDLHIAPYNPVHQTKIGFYHSHNNAIQLLSDFTRLHSLHLKGIRNTIAPVLDSLCRPLPVQSLSLTILESYAETSRDKRHTIWSISDGLFGGSAPIRQLHFTMMNGHIIMPHSLLHGVTHFTTNESISPSELLDMLPQMPTLTYLEIHRLDYLWSKFYMDSDELHFSPIEMPCLTTLITHTFDDPEAFMQLNRLLLLNAAVKRRVEVDQLQLHSWNDLSHWVSTGMSTLINATGGFQHIHFSEKLETSIRAWFRMWTGCLSTTWEDAEFCLVTRWKDSGYISGDSRTPFIALGVTRVRRLIIDFPHVNKFNPRDLSKSYWWEILKLLPGIEELELYYTGIGRGGFWRDVWEVRTAPAVLPALRRVRIGAGLYYATHHYAIVGNLPTRKIVRLQYPDSTDSVVAVSEAESAERELEDLSSGLLKFLRGLAGC